MAVDTAFEYGLARFIDFRDVAACERVRRIPRAALTEHPNPDFRMRVIDDAAEFYRAFADVSSFEDEVRRLIERASNSKSQADARAAR